MRGISGEQTGNAYRAASILPSGQWGGGALTESAQIEQELLNALMELGLSENTAPNLLKSLNSLGISGETATDLMQGIDAAKAKPKPKPKPITYPIYKTAAAAATAAKTAATRANTYKKPAIEAFNSTLIHYVSFKAAKTPEDKKKFLNLMIVDYNNAKKAFNACLAAYNTADNAATQAEKLAKTKPTNANKTQAADAREFANNAYVALSTEVFPALWGSGEICLQALNSLSR